MGEKMREKKGHESEKHREKTIEVEKGEKELEKAKKKKNKVFGNDGKTCNVMEALKTTCVEREEGTNVDANVGKDFDSLEEKKENKKMHKEEKKNKKKKKEGVDGISSLGENFEDDKMFELVKGQGHNKYCQKSPVVDSEVEQVEKKKKKKEEEEVADKISLLGENVEAEKINELVKEQGNNNNGLDIPVVNSEAEHDEKKKKKKKKKKKDGADAISTLGEDVEDDKMNDLVKGQEYKKNSQYIPVVNSEIEEAGKKKKRKREKKDGDNVEKNIVTDVQKLSKERNHSDGKVNEGSKLTVKEKIADKMLEDNEMGEAAKAQKGTESGDIAETNYNKEGDKSKKKKKRKRETASADVEEIIANEPGTESTRIRDCENVEYGDNVGSTEDNLHEGCTDVHATDAYEGKKKAQSAKLGKGDDCSKDKKKKAKVEKQVSDGNCHKGKPRTKKDSETNDSSENPTQQGKSKRVSFSDRVEVFSSSNGPSWSRKKQVEGLVRGKRFTPEEDEKVKEAVFGYIEERGLGDEGLNMVLNCKQYPEVKNCWKYIAASIPWRPHDSVYYRAHILFERDENRKWTAEEYEYILKYHKEHGSEWKKLSKHLNKHRIHVKDTFRRIKCTSLNKGRWSQEEYQNLFDLVNKDLRIRASEEKKSKHGMLRDNICWGAISEKLSSRHYAACCMKWYQQLTSSMVAEGLWVDTDDYRLLDALSILDAACIEDVDWDNLLEHRDGDICRKRWNQMVKHIGEYGNKSFSEQVEILSERYSLDVLEAREEYDSKEPVDLIVNNSDDSAP